MSPRPPSAWRQRATAFWAARAPREQRVLRLAALIVAAALVAQFLWSLETTRRRQLQQLPALHADLARLRTMHATWLGLRDDAAPAASGATLRNALNTRLGELGAGITPHWEGERLQLSGQTELATWLRWSAAIQHDYRLRIETCRVEGQGQQARIEASYRLAGEL